MHCISRHTRMFAWLLLGASVPLELHAQTGPGASWDSVAAILKAPVTQAAGYLRVNLPRRDLRLRLGDVEVAPALALGAWIGFSGEPASAMVMGDLVLTSAELGPVLAELARGGVDITAIHNHLVGAEPQLAYVHFHAAGTAVALARRLGAAIALTGTPLPVASAVAQPVTIDTAAVFTALGPGKAQGAVAQLSLVLVPDAVSMDGHPVLPAMGYGTPINLQAISPERLVATGDFAVLGQRVGPVLRALAAQGITATAVHTHLIGETPAVYYIHFWADGAPAAVLRGLRAAVDAAK